MSMTGALSLKVKNKKITNLEFSIKSKKLPTFKSVTSEINKENKAHNKTINEHKLYFHKKKE